METLDIREMFEQTDYSKKTTKYQLVQTIGNDQIQMPMVR